MPTISYNKKLKRKLYCKQKQQQQVLQKHGIQECPKQPNDLVPPQQQLAVGPPNVGTLTNEGKMEILGLLNIPTHQHPKSMALPEYPTKKIENMVLKFIPPNCRVVELGVQEVLPVGS